jgi:anti-sigma factor RsiW
MNAAARPVNEEELQAWVDGWLDPVRRAEVDRYLSERPEEAARLGDYRRHGEILRECLRGPDRDPVPDRLLLVARGAAPRRRPHWLPAAAAAVLLLAAGLGGGWGLRGILDKPGDMVSGADGGDLVTQATAAYRVYSVEVRHPVEVRAEEAHLIGWLSKRVGRPLSAPDLRDFGFRLMGGRLLPTADGAAAQFMYEDAAGRRVTSYMRADSSGKETAFRFTKQDGLAAFYWLDGGLGYALVGPLPRQEMLELARAMYRQLES